VANLMEFFEYYLLATFVLGAVQLRHYAATYRLVLRTPTRWPRLYEHLKKHLNELLTFPTLLIFGLMLGAWILHLFLRRAIWPDASVTPAQLREETLYLGLAVLSAFAMLVLDARALVRAATFRGPRMVWLIDLTEMALRSEVLPLKWLIHWRIRSKIARGLPLLHVWMWKRSAEIASRLVFGSTLWIVWIRHGGLG
jgi:hypothetical protein